MGAESEVLTHDVTVQDATVTRFGFGIPLIAANHNFWAERVRSFDEADDLLASPYNVPANHVIYLSAVRIKAQNPCPPSFKVGKLLGAITFTADLTPSAPAIGDVYSLTVDGAPVSTTADGTPTLAEICTSLATAISALADVTAVSSAGTKVIVTGDTAGLMHAIEDLTLNLALKDTTGLPTPSPTTDLAAIQSADPDWYALHLANGGEASIDNAAAWVETQKKLFVAQSSDTLVATSDTTDVASDVKTAGYTRSFVLFHHRPVSQQPAAGWEGLMLPKLPGPATWANKSIAGVDKSPLDSTQRAALAGKKANYYIDIRGLGFTLHGTAGSGRRADVTAFLDWFDIGVSDRIILMLHNNDVVPYTNKGIEIARAQVLGQIQEGIALGLIDGEEPFDVTAPKVTEVNPTDKADRVLPNIGYFYTLSGAIEKLKIKGVVKV